MLRLQTESSFMTFEGLQIQGAIKIMEKLTVSFFSYHLLFITMAIIF